MKNIGSMLKTFFKETFIYLTSKMFLINFGIAIAFLFMLLFLTFCGLKSYTNHGDSFPTPNLVGFTLDELESKEIAHLDDVHYEITDSSAFRWKDNVPGQIMAPNTIISQTPAASHLIKKDRTVRLTITPKKQPTVTFRASEIFTNTSSEAISRLRANRIHVIEKKKVTGNLGEGTVYQLEQDGKTIGFWNKKDPSLYKPKISIQKGSTVTLYVVTNFGEDGRESGIVPNLIKKYSFCGAKEYLSLLDYNVRVKFSDLPSDTCGGYQGLIYEQDPLPGTSLTLNSTISVSISRDGNTPSNPN